jgi:endonuclease/exonuclease/phosphatase (EEP) superfamily protein YafD
MDPEFLALCAVDPLIFAGDLNSGIRLARAQRLAEPSGLTEATDVAG